MNPSDYPLLKPGHSTSTLIVCMFVAFAIGFLTCHRVYTGIDRTNWEAQVKRDFYYDKLNP